LASYNIEDGVSARHSAIVVYEIWRACESMVVDNEGFVGQDGETSLNARAHAGAGVEGVGGVAGVGVAVEKKDGKMPKVEENARIVELDGEDGQSKQQAHPTPTFSGRIIRVLRQLAVLFVFTPLLAAARRSVTSALLSLFALFGPLSNLRFWATRILQIFVSIDWLLPLYWAFDKLPSALKLQLLSVLKHLVSQAASIPGFLAFLQEAFQEKALALFSVAAAWFQRGIGDYCGALYAGTDTCIITASTCSVDGIMTTTIRLSDCPDIIVTTTKTETETLIPTIQDMPLPNAGGAALTSNSEFFTSRAIEANTTDPWDSTDPVQITSADQFTCSRSFSQPEDGLARVTDLMVSPSPRTSTTPLPLTSPDSTTSSRTVSPSTALTPDGAHAPTPGYIGTFFNVVADHPYRCGEWTFVVILFAILYLVLGRRDAEEEGEEGDCDGVQDEMSLTCDLDLLQQATCTILLAGQKLMLGMS